MPFELPDPFPEFNDRDPTIKPNWNYLAERSSNRFRHGDGVIHGQVSVRRDERPANKAREAAIATEDRILRSFVDAVNTAATAHRADVTDWVCKTVAGRRSDLEWHGELQRGLVLEPRPPQLDLQPSLRDPSSLRLPPPQLVDPSVAAILGTIDRWADEVERYPEAFARLASGQRGEDRMSDLLAATLGVAFGVSGREVFSRSGKSDIYIPVSAIRALKGNPQSGDEGNAFIIEAKKGSGEAKTLSAQAQLGNYTPPSATHSALLFYVTAADLNGARSRILRALQAHPEYIEEATVAGITRPLLRFRRAGEHDVVLAVVTIHIHST